MTDKASRSLYKHISVGVFFSLVFLGGVLVWAIEMNISGAVIAPGVVTLNNGSKKIQPPLGGVISKINVQEGQRVQAGDVLVTLDPTVQGANVNILSASLNKIYSENARLEAEINGAGHLSVPDELSARVSIEQAQVLINNEQILFAKRRDSLSAQKNELAERVNQLQDQILGSQKQQISKLEENRLIEQELNSVKILYNKGLMTLDRLNALLRAQARLKGESAHLLADIAEAKGKIAEIKIQILQVDQVSRSESLATLRDNSARADELVEREIAAKHQLSQIEIKSPISGQVFQLAVHTVGGVVSTAEHLMDVVPTETDMIVEARVSAEDIDQLYISQRAMLRLTAFNRNTTPELVGQVDRVSADLIMDDRTNIGYYKIGIKLPFEEVKRLDGVTLVPGMPVEVFMETGSRSVISYLVKPVVDHTQRAFRES